MLPNVKINIGQYYASQDPLLISTTLGSCVSVCLYDPNSKIGGMNHILYTGKSRTSGDLSGLYGNNAMELLINEMVGLGAKRKLLIAKVFGGANILGFSEQFQQGIRNVEFVLNFLATNDIEVVAKNTGGRFARKLFFQTNTNEVLLKKTTAKMQSHLAVETGEAALRVKSISNKSREITLF